MHSRMAGAKATIAEYQGFVWNGSTIQPRILVHNPTKNENRAMKNVVSDTAKNIQFALKVQQKTCNLYWKTVFFEIKAKIQKAESTKTGPVDPIMVNGWPDNKE
uniref:Uncharacterized protein n=1 Tax=Romanomermis culicivorax TaxID=13658 RepID=A0A915J0R1_ROMCU